MKEQLKKLFPFISAAASLGGPLGTMAANAVGKALGVDKIDPSADGVADAIAASKDPEAMLKLRQAEQNFQIEMEKMGFAHVEELERIAAADRDSARGREIKTGDSWTPRLIAGAVVVGWLFVQWFLLKHIIPAEMRDINMRSLGTLDMALGLVLGYYFGSSASSRNKDQALSDLAKGNQ
jgi:hypothetical protein